MEWCAHSPFSVGSTEKGLAVWFISYSSSDSRRTKDLAHGRVFVGSLVTWVEMGNTKSLNGTALPLVQVA